MEDLEKIVRNCMETDTILLYGNYDKENPPLLDIPDDIDTKEAKMLNIRNHMKGDAVNG